VALLQPVITKNSRNPAGPIRPGRPKTSSNRPNSSVFLAVLLCHGPIYRRRSFKVIWSQNANSLPPPAGPGLRVVTATDNRTTRRRTVPPTFIKLVLTGPAQTWYTLPFANDMEATESQIALGLRKAFGQEYAGVWALRALYHVSPSPEKSGAQRLLVLDHREEQARQHRVPRDAGPCETRFCPVLALFLPEELNPFLGALTADPHCSEAALRQLEETPPHSGGPAANGRPSIAPASPDREALFAVRVQLAQSCRGGPPPHSSTVAGCWACPPSPDGWIHRDPTGPFTRAPPGHAVSAPAQPRRWHRQACSTITSQCAAG
jgi:hypothetical protein